MRFTQLFGRTLRERRADVESASHDLLERACYVRQHAAGIYTYLTLGLHSLRRVEAIIRDEMNASGAQEILMSMVHDADVWKRTGRYESIDDTMVRFTDRRGRDCVLGMTHEEIVASLAVTELRSYRDVDVVVYQIQTKFRDEARSRGGLLRTREFLMKDAYSMHLTADGLANAYATQSSAYRTIFQRLGLHDVAMVESSTGLMGGTRAHEFMCFLDVGEDTVVVCADCGYAANVDVAGDARLCAQCNGVLVQRRGVEVGNIFQLGSRYTDALGVAVTDANGRRRSVIMGSYGIGVSRLLACLVERFHDERGIALTAATAAVDAHLLVLGRQHDSLEERAVALEREAFARAASIFCGTTELPCLRVKSSPTPISSEGRSGSRWDATPPRREQSSCASGDRGVCTPFPWTARSKRCSDCVRTFFSPRVPNPDGVQFDDSTNEPSGESGMPVDRRQFLHTLAAMGAASRFGGVHEMNTPMPAEMTTRKIPRTGEAIPVIGMGTWQTFDPPSPTRAAVDRLAEVLRVFIAGGGRVIDSSPMYGRSEEHTGALLQRLRAIDSVFLATKVWTTGAAAGRRQLDASSRLFHRDKIDLEQVHNLVDWRAQLDMLRAAKQEGRIRYVGVTHYTASSFGELEKVIRSEHVDFVQLPYSVRFRAAESRLLPAAADTGTAVIVNEPFQGGDLFASARGKSIPEWASPFGSSWAQLFLKFIVSHPAVTCVIPATANPEHMRDDLGAGAGALLSNEERTRLLRVLGA